MAPALSNQRIAYFNGRYVPESQVVLTSIGIIEDDLGVALRLRS